MPAISKLAAAVFLMLAVSHHVSAQSFYVSRIWMRVYGDANAQENLVFGNTEINTFGIDSTAPGAFKEFEPPVAMEPAAALTPPGFDVYWMLPPGHAGQWGSYRGLLGRDWRHLDAPYEARKDTWALLFGQYDNSGATISFKWPDAAELASQCDSLLLYDPSGKMGWPNYRLDMFTTDTLTIPAAGDSGIGRFRIFKTGAKGTLGAEETQPLPTELALLRNYPNPFNPVTTIEAKVPEREFVTVKIYDILGREVATLFSGMLARGTRAFIWQAAGQPSGVYVAVLTAARRSLTQKLVLAR